MRSGDPGFVLTLLNEALVSFVKGETIYSSDFFMFWLYEIALFCGGRSLRKCCVHAEGCCNVIFNVYIQLITIRIVI